MPISSRGGAVRVGPRARRMRHSVQEHVRTDGSVVHTDFYDTWASLFAPKRQNLARFSILWYTQFSPREIPGFDSNSRFFAFWEGSKF